MKRIINYLLQGLLYIAPIGITLYVIYVVFNFIDNLLKSWLDEVLGLHVPGLGVVLILALLIIIGVLGQTIIAQPIKYLFSRLLNRAPIVKVIYSALNDLFSAFVGKERKFNKPVLVKVNLTSNLEKMGFVTEEDLSSINEAGKVAVYFPHSYNFSGEMFIVPKDQVRHLDIPPAEIMKFVVSAGVAGWSSENEKEQNKK